MQFSPMHTLDIIFGRLIGRLIQKGNYPHGTYGATMGAGSAGQSGANVGGVDPQLFCGTGVMTPICK
ncbi:MAG: hypothetical protein WA364_23880 [Candidatus Nitrosopolaris sp.]